MRLTLGAAGSLLGLGGWLPWLLGLERAAGAKKAVLERAGAIPEGAEGVWRVPGEGGQPGGRGEEGER